MCAPRSRLALVTSSPRAAPSCGCPYALESTSQAQLGSPHASDGEAQEYLDARIEALEGIVQKLAEVAGRLHVATRATAG